MEFKFKVKGREKVKQILGAWASLCSQGDYPPPPEAGDLFNWALSVKESAWEGEEEGFPPPISKVSLERGKLILVWEGSWTRGRKIEVIVFFDNNLHPIAEVSVKTGTGNWSRFLQWWQEAAGIHVLFEDVDKQKKAVYCPLCGAVNRFYFPPDETWWEVKKACLHYAGMTGNWQFPVAIFRKFSATD